MPGSFLAFAGGTVACPHASLQGRLGEARCSSTHNGIRSSHDSPRRVSPYRLRWNTSGFHGLPASYRLFSATKAGHIHNGIALANATAKSASSARVASREVMSATARVAVQPEGTVALAPADGLTFLERAEKYARDGNIPETVVNVLTGWYDSYIGAATDSEHVSIDGKEYTEQQFSTLMELARRHVEDPLDFAPFHEKMRSPFDYYKFSLEFATVLVNTSNSHIKGHDQIRKLREQIKAGENVIFLANHQSEGDPYAIDALFDWVAGMDREFCENIVFMAGDRVREDPVVAPFSMGRNLLTVYSKKHINDVPELRGAKLLHNRRTIGAALSLFNEGGHCIWFAPSGGRDRRSPETGNVEVSPFDADSVDMMRITAQKSSKPCHFYPMSLLTYDMLPPPSTVGGAQLGETRTVKFTPMSMVISEEVNWDTLVPADVTDKIERRKMRARAIEETVRKGYESVGGYEF